MPKRWFLTPLSWLYGLVTDIRNHLYDSGTLSSESFPLPVICVGNLTVGGTGKTPHTDHLIRLLKDSHRVAFLSRGYRRKSKGFRLADTNCTACDIGDEPYQVWLNHPDIYVAVDTDRRNGIKRLLNASQTADTQVVLLDDAYQHRRVRPGLNILLCDYNRMPYDDHLLPWGRLRETFPNRYRADIIVVTKCPPDMQPIDFRVVLNHLAPKANQKVFFSTYDYGVPIPFSQWKQARSTGKKPLIPGTQVLLLTGIAQPQSLVQYLKGKTGRTEVLSYPDHHNFVQADIKKAVRQFNRLNAASDRRIVLTEKDAARLVHDSKLQALLPAETYVLPVQVHFLLNQQQTFNNIITDYVRKNSAHGSVH